MPAANTTATPAVDNRKLEAAAKRAEKKANRAKWAAHNARIEADRAAAAHEVSAHEALFGADAYECA